MPSRNGGDEKLAEVAEDAVAPGWFRSSTLDHCIFFGDGPLPLGDEVRQVVEVCVVEKGEKLDSGGGYGGLVGSRAKVEDGPAASMEGGSYAEGGSYVASCWDAGEEEDGFITMVDLLMGAHPG